MTIEGKVTTGKYLFSIGNTPHAEFVCPQNWRIDRGGLNHQILSVYDGDKASYDGAMPEGVGGALLLEMAKYFKPSSVGFSGDIFAMHTFPEKDTVFVQIAKGGTVAMNIAHEYWDRSEVTFTHK